MADFECCDEDLSTSPAPIMKSVIRCVSPNFFRVISAAHLRSVRIYLPRSWRRAGEGLGPAPGERLQLHLVKRSSPRGSHTSACVARHAAAHVAFPCDGAADASPCRQCAAAATFAGCILRQCSAVASFDGCILRCMAGGRAGTSARGRCLRGRLCRFGTGRGGMAAALSRQPGPLAPPSPSRETHQGDHRNRARHCGGERLCARSTTWWRPGDHRRSLLR